MLEEGPKKTALRMIPYGLFVMAARNGDEIATATINWISQCSFHPPLVMIGVKADTHIHAVIKAVNNFAVNICGHDQKSLAASFFALKNIEADKLNGHPFTAGKTGAPLLEECPAYFECKLVDTIERGDHSVFVAEVIAAGVRREEETLLLKDTGWHYGG
jgi:flavin reductase (DIM6/NTAB) family NADH-FMN oxidoreductase RutF